MLHSIALLRYGRSAASQNMSLQIVQTECFNKKCFTMSMSLVSVHLSLFLSVHKICASHACLRHIAQHEQPLIFCTDPKSSGKARKKATCILWSINLPTKHALVPFWMLKRSTRAQWTTQHPHPLQWRPANKVPLQGQIVVA